MKTRLSPERWLYRLVRRVWSMATAIRRLSEDEPGYRERVAFQMGVFDGRNKGYPCASPFIIPAGRYHCDLSEAWCTGHSVGAKDFASPNTGDVARPAAGEHSP